VGGRDHASTRTARSFGPVRALAFVQGLLGEGWTLRGIAATRRTPMVVLWSLRHHGREIFGWSRPQPRRRSRPSDHA
jgi:hypothetical protein